MGDDDVNNREKTLFTGEKPEGARDLSWKERIYGPNEDQNKTHNKAIGLFNTLFLGPVEWFHDTVLSKTRDEPVPWYHRRYRRVPTIDECYFSDIQCRVEANIQMGRDMMVEKEIIRILRHRALDCQHYEGHVDSLKDKRYTSKCGELLNDMEKAEANYYIKYGDLQWPVNASAVLMKQKHRMIYERRHGSLPANNKILVE